MAVPALYNNTPGVGSISWDGFNIRYAGQSFAVPAAYSANKFVWWQFNKGADAEPSVRTQLMLNSEMRVNSTGWASTGSGWTGSRQAEGDGTYRWRATPIVAAPTVSQYCLQMATSTTHGPFVAGDHVFHRIQARMAPGKTRNVRFRLRYYLANVAGAFLTGLNVVDKTVALTEDWQEIYLDGGIMPAATVADGVSVWVNENPAAGGWALDGTEYVEFRKPVLASGPDWGPDSSFGGSTTDTADWDYAWTGTVNASPSTATPKVPWMPTLNAADTLPTTLSEDDLLLFLNKNGTAVGAQNTQIIDGSLIVSQSILADALSANSVTGEKILAGSVNATHILAGSIGTNELSALAVTADKIAANAITVDKLATNSVTSDKILANSITADKFSANAITSAIILAGILSADTAIIAASLRTADIIISGGAQINGADNLLGGKISMQAYPTAPKTAPTVGPGYVETATLASTSVSGACLSPDGTTWAVVEGSVLKTYSATTGALIATSGDLLAGITSSAASDVTNIGGTWYVLIRQFQPGPFIWTPYSRSVSSDLSVIGTAYPLAVSAHSSDPNQGRIGNDGTSLWYAQAGYEGGESTQKVRFRKYPVNSGTQSGATITTPNVSFETLHALYVGAADTGTSTFWVTGKLAGATKSHMRTYNLTTGALVSSAYAVANDTEDRAGRGLSWDGTRFWSLGGDPNLNGVLKYAALPAATRYVGYTWYDSDATGGTHETMLSPTKSIALSAYAYLKVTTPAVPDFGDPDDPTQARIYIGSSATTTKLQPDLAAGQVESLYDTFATTTDPPLTEGFSTLTGKAGSLVSTATDVGGEIIKLTGTGQGRTGPYQWDALGKQVDGDPTYDTGWVNLTILSGFTLNGVARCRRIGKMVQVQVQSIKNTSAISVAATGSMTDTSIANVPAGFRPSVQVRAPALANRGLWCSVGAAGDVILNAGDASGTAWTVTAASDIGMSAFYFID